MKCNSCGQSIVKCIICGSTFLSGEQIVCTCYQDHLCMNEDCAMQHFSFQTTSCEKESK